MFTNVTKLGRKSPTASFIAAEEREVNIFRECFSRESQEKDFSYISVQEESNDNYWH